MKRLFTRRIIMAGALTIMGMGINGIVPGAMSKTEAAPWLAPAPHQEMSATWVKDVARELRQPEYRNIFMNIPFGSPQATILDFLNEAAFGLENGHPRYARELVRQAVNVLDETAGEGWYSPSNVRPIQAMILKKAKEGFREAGYEWRNKQLRTQASQRSQREEDRRWMRGGERLFDPDRPNQPRNRYQDYTSEHWQSGNNPRTGEQSRDRNFQRERERDMDLRGQNTRDRRQLDGKQFGDFRGMRDIDRNRDRGRFTEEEWREHAPQHGEDARGMRSFDRSRDRDRFSQRQFEDSRGMRDFDRTRDRFIQNQGRDSRDMRDRNRDRGRFTEEEWREHAPQHGEDLRGMRDFNRDRNKFAQDRGRNSRSMRDFDRNRY